MLCCLYKLGGCCFFLSIAPFHFPQLPTRFHYHSKILCRPPLARPLLHPSACPSVTRLPIPLLPTILLAGPPRLLLASPPRPLLTNPLRFLLTSSPSPLHTSPWTVTLTPKAKADQSVHVNANIMSVQRGCLRSRSPIKVTPKLY